MPRSTASSSRLTPRVLRLGYAWLASTALPQLVQPFLERLSEETHESSSASLLDGHEIVYIARSAQRRIMSVGLSVGSRLPAFCSSMGRVLLAARPSRRGARADAGRQAARADAAHRHRYRPADGDPGAGARAGLHASSIRSSNSGWSRWPCRCSTQRGEVVAAFNLSAQVQRHSAQEMAERFLPRMRADPGAAAAADRMKPKPGHGHAIVRLDQPAPLPRASTPTAAASSPRCDWRGPDGRTHQLLQAGRGPARLRRRARTCSAPGRCCPSPTAPSAASSTMATSRFTVPDNDPGGTIHGFGWQSAWQMPGHGRRPYRARTSPRRAARTPIATARRQEISLDRAGMTIGIAVTNEAGPGTTLRHRASSLVCLRARYAAADAGGGAGLRRGLPRHRHRSLDAGGPYAKAPSSRPAARPPGASSAGTAWRGSRRPPPASPSR